MFQLRLLQVQVRRVHIACDLLVQSAVSHDDGAVRSSEY